MSCDIFKNMRIYAYPLFQTVMSLITQTPPTCKRSADYPSQFTDSHFTEGQVAS